MVKKLDTGEVIIGKWIKKEVLPYGKISCADCGKHRPMFYLGKHGDQTWLCEECLRKVIKNKKHDAYEVTENEYDTN